MSSIAGAPFLEFWFWSGALAIAVISAFFASFRFFRHARLMEDIPTARVRSAPQGYVELLGTARLMDGPPIVCPLSGTPCLWWNYHVQKKVRSGKNTHWRTVSKGQSEDLFWLEDDTGRVVVDPAGATVVPGITRTWYGNSPHPSQPPATGSVLGGGGYRYSEKLLAMDSPLYALGEFTTRRHTGDRQQLQQEVKLLLGEWKNDPERMKLFDINNDGQVDAKEWEAAHRLAEKTVRDENARRDANSGIDMLIKPRNKPHPFILSAQPQDKLSRKYQRQAAGCFLFFLAGGSGFIWLMMARGVFGQML